MPTAFEPQPEHVHAPDTCVNKGLTQAKIASLTCMHAPGCPSEIMRHLNATLRTSVYFNHPHISNRLADLLKPLTS